MLAEIMNVLEVFERKVLRTIRGVVGVQQKLTILLHRTAWTDRNGSILVDYAALTASVIGASVQGFYHSKNREPPCA